MKKLENFSNCLDILKSADFEYADRDVIYRTGVFWQFYLTFELAWKASMRNSSEGVAERRLLCSCNVHKTMSEKVVYETSSLYDTMIKNKQQETKQQQNYAVYCRVS